ncbi:MAG TPA: hypothetical protein VKB28_00625 [Solirubrobacteraceae bacterium]|nr:hypothetical protein [Solirubrobacteraceae bacterium]
MRRCSVLGHDYRFSAEDATMRWSCDRCGEDGGSKTYATAAEAQRYARAFDRRDAENVGKRPLLSLLPLWLARKAGRRGGR